MEQYIAFLRGINVSGQKIIKMESLRKAFSDSGFNDVKTYIQSGNVLFVTDEKDEEVLNTRIEDLIVNYFGFRTDVILRKHTDIKSVINLFHLNIQADEKRKYYITFLKKEYSELLLVPVFSKNQDVEIIYHNSRDFVSISGLYKGNYGFPNSFIEKLTGIPATTRNPNTLKKITEL